MQWYYAIDGQRHGPVSEQEFARLIAHGTVTGETLVWRAGIEAWAPWSALAASNPLPEVSSDELGDDEGGPALHPGEDSGEESAAWTIDEFSQRLREQGFSTSIGGILGRAWETYKAGFWPCLGVTLLGYLILMIVGLIPLVGMLSIVLVTPQITAGLAWYFLRRHRGEQPGIETLFEGFSRAFGALALVGLLQAAVTIVLVLPVAMLAGAMGVLGQNSGEPAVGPAVGLMAFVFVWAIAAALLMYRLILAHVIVMDLRVGAIDAFKLSWRIMGLRFWPLVGLAIILLLLGLAGVLALLVGAMLVAPMWPSCLAQVYEDARLSAAGRPPEA